MTGGHPKLTIPCKKRVKLEGEITMSVNFRVCNMALYYSDAVEYFIAKRLVFHIIGVLSFMIIISASSHVKAIENTPIDKIIECKQITDDLKRLICFDSIDLSKNSVNKTDIIDDLFNLSVEKNANRIKNIELSDCILKISTIYQGNNYPTKETYTINLKFVALGQSFNSHRGYGSVFVMNKGYGIFSEWVTWEKKTSKVLASRSGHSDDRTKDIVVAAEPEDRLRVESILRELISTCQG